MYGVCEPAGVNTFVCMLDCNSLYCQLVPLDVVTVLQHFRQFCRQSVAGKPISSFPHRQGSSVAYYGDSGKAGLIKGCKGKLIGKRTY